MIFKDYPNCQRGHQYALDIISGKIPSSIYTKAACKRYLTDLERIDKDTNCPFYFVPEKAEKYLRLVQKFTHVIGKWETGVILYEPWQCFFKMNVMGFHSKQTKERRFRTAYCEVSRGNSKSTMASQMALFFLALDNPIGNQIACVATRREQARIVLDSARAMAKANASYLKNTGVEVLAHQIVHEKTNSHIRALSSDSSGLDGRADILTICDELHAMQRKTFEVVESGMSKRNDSLMLCITTAGYDVDNVGHAQSSYAKKVALGDIEDDTFLSLVYTLDDGDDPLNPDVWIKANPNFGVSVDPINFAAKAKKARENASDYNNFKIKHLNLWIGESTEFFSKDALKQCANPSLTLDSFKGKACYIGVDLASKVDLCSIYYMFYDGKKYSGFSRSYLPEARLDDSRNVKYLQWVSEGHLIKHPGEVIDYDIILKQLIEDSKTFKVRGIHIDPWQAQMLMQGLSKAGVEAVEFKMSTSNLSEPMKLLDAIMRKNIFEYNGNGLFNWCIGNVIAKEDANQNVFPRKPHERLKIDEVVAAIMALAGWVNEKAPEKSVYESRGIRTV